MTRSLLHPFRGSRAALSFMLIAAAASCGGGGTDPVRVASVEVSPPTSSKVMGETVQLTATPKGPNGAALSARAVAWLSSSTAIATVTNTGLVTAVGGGTATITAAIEGQTGTASVTVSQPVASSVTVAPPTLNVKEGNTATLVATPKAADGTTLTGKTVTWTSSAVANATVSSAGVVTGVLPGTATITATVDGKTATSAVTVSVNPCLHGVTIAVGQSIDGVLDPVADCNQLYTDNSLADAYVLTIAATTTVQIDLVSTAFDAFIRLENVVNGVRSLEVEENDSFINGTNARITRSLVARNYVIWANSFDPAGQGIYTLSVKLPAGIAANTVRLERATKAQLLALRTPVRRGH